MRRSPVDPFALARLQATAAPLVVVPRRCRPSSSAPFVAFVTSSDARVVQMALRCTRGGTPAPHACLASRSVHSRRTAHPNAFGLPQFFPRLWPGPSVVCATVESDCTFRRPLGTFPLAGHALLELLSSAGERMASRLVSPGGAFVLTAMPSCSAGPQLNVLRNARALRNKNIGCLARAKANILFNLAGLHQRRQHDEGLHMPQGRTFQPLRALAPDRHASLALALLVCFE